MSVDSAVTTASSRHHWASTSRTTAGRNRYRERCWCMVADFVARRLNIAVPSPVLVVWESLAGAVFCSSGASFTSSSTVCSSAPIRRSPSASSRLRVASCRSRSFSFAVRNFACASRSSSRSLCSSVTLRRPSSISSSVVFLICSILRFDSSFSLSRSRSTSNSVWRRSRASVDVSCTSRCSSSRSFCQDSSRRVLVPGTFDLPLPIIFSSSSSLILDCISEILISDALSSDTSSVRTLLASRRASLSSSSRQPICCSSATIFVLSSSSPLLLVTDARLRRFAFMSPICFWAASTSCLNVSRSRLNRSHCRCIASCCLSSSAVFMRFFSSSMLAYRLSLFVSAAVSFFCTSTNRRLMLVFSFTSLVSIASAWSSLFFSLSSSCNFSRSAASCAWVTRCSSSMVSCFCSSSSNFLLCWWISVLLDLGLILFIVLLEALRFGAQYRRLLLDHLQLSLQVLYLLFGECINAISACNRSNSRSFSINFLRSSLISSSITVIFFSSSGSFTPDLLPSAEGTLRPSSFVFVARFSCRSLICSRACLFSCSSSSILRRNTAISCSFSSSWRRNSAGSSSSEMPSSFSTGAGSALERDVGAGLSFLAFEKMLLFAPPLKNHLLFAFVAIFFSCITSESFSSSTRDDLRRRFSASSSAYFSCSRRSASRSSESCRSRSSWAGSSCEPPRVSEARDILLSADVDLPMLPRLGVRFVGEVGAEPELSSSACSRRATSFDTFSSSSSCLIFAARSPLAPSAAFSDSSCSIRRSDFFSLNDSIRQFLVVWSSSFFSDAYSSACSSRKLSCISSISVSMLRSSRLISSFSSISSSQSVSACSSFWRSCSSMPRPPRALMSADSSFSLVVRNFFSSCRSSISCFCSFTFCCSFSASDAAVLFDTVSIEASRRSSMSLLSRSARSARALTVSSSRLRLSFSSCSSRRSVWSTMVASVVSVVSVVIDRSSSAFAFLSLIEMRNLTSSLLVLGTCGSLAGRMVLLGWKDAIVGLDWVSVVFEVDVEVEVDVEDDDDDDGVEDSSVRRLRMMVFVGVVAVDSLVCDSLPGEAALGCVVLANVTEGLAALLPLTLEEVFVEEEEDEEELVTLESELVAAGAV
uniref:Uncharacterized protein n=1 Tax=Anopheles merus TaxID=30066 RepID=A0A182VAI0_ANOME